MTASPPRQRSGTTQAVYSQAVAHCLVAFSFRDAPRCSAVMLWSVLVWAASRTKSLYHAAQRLYPDTQDLTFWNRLRANLPKQVPALERRLNELLRLPSFLPWPAACSRSPSTTTPFRTTASPKKSPRTATR
jgi:hypothetical protein